MPNQAGKLSVKELREKVLKQRGLTLKTTGVHSHSRIVAHLVGPDLDEYKTPMMKYLEQKYALRLDQLLQECSLTQACKRLGREVDTTTLSKWKLRLGITYNDEHLPACEGCLTEDDKCDFGYCSILYERGRYDLMLIKKREVLGP
jgi:hypothetical protein